MIKIIGIGNILLSDDGIGVRVLETIKNDILEWDNDIEVIIGENDYLYCLDNINKDDFVIIIDSSYFSKKAGEITVLTLEECDKFIKNMEFEHEVNLVKALRMEYKNIKGYLITIEIESLDYSLELSKILQSKFNHICNQVLSIIKKIIKSQRKINNHE